MSSRGPRATQLDLFGSASAVPATATEASAPERPTAPAPADEDAAARQFAVRPEHDVVLEASAGTGKTSVLVAR